MKSEKRLLSVLSDCIPTGVIFAACRSVQRAAADHVLLDAAAIVEDREDWRVAIPQPLCKLSVAHVHRRVEVGRPFPGAVVEAIEVQRRAALLDHIDETRCSPWGTLRRFH